MKILVLVRHAKSDWGDRDLPDFDRSLNERGKRDAPRMATYLKQYGIVPQRIISSPANRARTTAKIFAESLGLNESIVSFVSDIYDATVDDLLAVVRCFDEDAACCMLVGHNPGMTNLANQLMSRQSGHIENIPTAGIVILNLDISGWQLLESNQAQLVSFMKPADLAF